MELPPCSVYSFFFDYSVLHVTISILYEFSQKQVIPFSFEILLFLVLPKFFSFLIVTTHIYIYTSTYTRKNWVKTRTALGMRDFCFIFLMSSSIIVSNLNSEVNPIMMLLVKLPNFSGYGIGPLESVQKKALNMLDGMSVTGKTQKEEQWVWSV